MGTALPRRSRPLRAAGPGQAAWRHGGDATLITVAGAGALAGISTAWIVVHGGPGRPAVPNLPLAVPLAVLIGWSFIGSGLLYLRSRPDNHLGPVMIFQGFAWFASRLFVSEYTVQKHVGNIFDTLRLPPSPDDHRRVLAVVAYLNA